MGFRINNNITALVAQGNLNKTQNGLSKSIERLSSGLRINRGADDAAGLTISEKLRGQIRGLNRATANAQDGISLIQTAEGALNEDASMLNRLRELAIQSQDDALTSGDRLEIQKEVDQLVDEIDRISETTEFNTKKLLDGSASSLVSTDHKDLRAFQTGAATETAGDYRVDVALSTVGVSQVQKSAILTDISSGNKAGLSTKLNDLSTMVDNSGNKILESPKTITIRANGQKADITISSDLTIKQFTDKVEEAVTKSVDDGGLGLKGSTFGFDVSKAQIVFESGQKGVNGELSIAADEGLLKAFGMQITTESVNAAYKVSATTTGVSNPTTVSANTTTGSAGGVIDGMKLNFELASEARIDGTVEAQAMITIPGTSSMDPNVALIPDNLLNDVVFIIHDTNASSSERGGGTLSAGIKVRLTAGRSFTMNSIANIINTLAQSANNPNSSLAKIIEYSPGATPGLYGSGSMQNPGFQASFDGYNLKISSSIGGSSGSISILANPAATAVLGLQTGRVLGSSGTAAVITGSTDISSGVTLAGPSTELLRIRIFDADFNSTDPAANTAPQHQNEVSFQRGTAISATSIVDTFNSAFSAGGLDITASINSSGSLEFRSGETGGDAKISITAVISAGNGASLTGGLANLGLISGQNAVGSGGNAAVFTGQTSLTSATTGHVLTGGFRFKVTDSSGASSGAIHFGSDGINGTGAFADSGGTDVLASSNYTNISFSLSKADITSIIDASNLSSTDIDFSFDAAGRLDFTSRSVGESSRIVISNVGNTDSINALNSYGFDTNQAVQGDGKTSFNLHVADRSLNFQIGANQKQAIQFGIINTSAEALGLKGLDITNVKSATRALGAIDTAVQIISSERSKLGSLQNRLNSTINNLTVTATNLQSTESKIRDVDVAKETVEFTRNQIMMQAGTAQLAQAKGLNQNALQLLG
ncbi:MAG: hypothetical protein COB02_11355 [Candidatus Cloacimonadota bacterium]|nr:MAG: hypothetical protein COB02_11355 [Candidatus Cloacimonadota bacterium]